MKLSIVINTKNASKTLKQCLESASFADEIIVVDMHSTDETVNIAKKFTDKIFLHDDLEYADPARDFAISKASNYWIFVLDADEEISPYLKTIIKNIIASSDSSDAYWIPRKNIVFNKWIEKTGWWPDYQMRLFKKGMVSWKVGVHRHPDVSGKVEYLLAEEKFSIIHHNYHSLEEFIERLNRYTSIQAKEGFSSSKVSGSISQDEVLSVFFEEFLTRFFSKEGVDEGVHGVGLSLLQSFYQVSMTLKLWQANDFKSKKTNYKKTFNIISKFKNDLDYWIADWHVKNSSGIKNIYWRLKRKIC